MDDRHVNIPELRSAAKGMRRELETAVRFYKVEEEREIITAFGFWFLHGPESVPEGMARDEIDFPKMEAVRGETMKDFMTVPEELLYGYGIWSTRYRESVDQALRAMHPVLTDWEGQKTEVTPAMRSKVSNREGEQCDMCNTPLSNQKPVSKPILTIDHIVPEILGGPTEAWNLRVLCRRCNSFKHVLLDPKGIEKVADRLEKRIAN